MSSFTTRIPDGVAQLELDVPGEPVNKNDRRRPAG